MANKKQKSITKLCAIVSTLTLLLGFLLLTASQGLYVQEKMVSHAEQPLSLFEESLLVKLLDIFGCILLMVPLLMLAVILLMKILKVIRNLVKNKSRRYVSIMKGIICSIIIILLTCVGVYEIIQYVRHCKIVGKYEKTEELLWNIPYGNERKAAFIKDAWGRVFQVTSSSNSLFVIRSQGEQIKDARDDIALHRVFTPDVETFLKKNAEEQPISVYQKIIYFDESKISHRFKAENYD